jgi:6-phosphogluconolactonase
MSKLLIGCYTNSSEVYGLHLCEFDSVKESITILSSLEVENASYITYNPNNSVAYVVNENHTLLDSLTAISVNIKENALKVINKISSGGADPCYVSISSDAKHIFSANYSDGSLSIASIDTDGALIENLQIIKHKVRDRTNVNSHMHAVVLSPGEDYLVASNLGLDTLTVYCYDKHSTTTPLDLINALTVAIPKGTGPRHIAFSSSGNYILIVGELNATLNLYTWKEGRMELKQIVQLMPMEFLNTNSAADIHFSSDGKFVYVSNRGDANQIIYYLFDDVIGSLSYAGRFSTQGIGPRNFALDPSGAHMLVAHQASNNIKFFKTDKTTGATTPMDITLNIHNPVCIRFLE